MDKIKWLVGAGIIAGLSYLGWRYMRNAFKIDANLREIDNHLSEIKGAKNLKRAKSESTRAQQKLRKCITPYT